MRKRMSGTRGTALVLVMWTIGWGLGFGGLAELFVDPNGETMDIWPAEMAIPGFVGGIIFALLLWIGERGRYFDDVPLVRITVWGAVSGLALAAISIATGGPIPLDLSTAEMMGVATGLGAVAGFGSGVFFWLVSRGQSLNLRGRS